MIFKFNAIVLFSFISTVTFAQSTFFIGGNICNSQDWILVFSDEFDSDSLDKTKWINYYPYSATGDDQCEFCRTHGDEGQVYLDSNVIVNQGTLKLMARKQSVTWFSANRDYSSGMIYSKHPISYMYGRFETRCKIPYGMGFWPAFWMWGGNGTEIDVFEFGCQAPFHHHYGCGVWEGSNKLASFGGSYDGIDFSLDFHVFSVDWDPFFLSYKVDGTEVYKICRFYEPGGAEVTWCCVPTGTYNVQPAYPHGPENKVQLIANLAIGNDNTPFTHAPDTNTIIPNQFEIDYIRVYQRATYRDTINECQVILYPNPAHDKLFVKCKMMSGVRIDNVFGQHLFSATADSDEKEIDVLSFPKGVYIVEVESEHDILTGKFIKQ